MMANAVVRHMLCLPLPLRTGLLRLKKLGTHRFKSSFACMRHVAHALELLLHTRQGLGRRIRVRVRRRGLLRRLSLFRRRRLLSRLLPRMLDGVHRGTLEAIQSLLSALQLFCDTGHMLNRL